MRIVLGGMVAGVPGHGGATWSVLQYALGLRRLGHEVLVVETVPGEAVPPAVASYASAALAGAGLSDWWSIVPEGGAECAGLSRRDVLAFAGDAELVVNLAGALRDPEILGRVATRLFVDIDPGFTQVWHHGYGVDVGLDDHTHFATYGHGLASGTSLAPACGRSWQATLPPVVLEHWPASPHGGSAWTTVANWRSYGTVEHGGVRYGQKAHSWRELVTLPRLVGERFEVALGIDEAEDADRGALAAAGWHVVDPSLVAFSPGAYRRFVSRSRAEIAVAKRGYVDAATGWFSDRSACYLATGRPVVAQDTGFSAYLPTGTGLLAFTDLDEAAEAVRAVARGMAEHRAAAVDLARAFFDSDRVLPALLEVAAVAA